MGNSNWDDRFLADAVLYEDNHLLIVNKPAPLATMGTTASVPSLLDLAKSYLKKKYDKPGNVYLGIVSRLDMMVTGAIVLARTSKAAARLTRQFAANKVEKSYWALTQSAPRPTEQECEDWLAKDDMAHRMRVVSRSTPGAKLARLSYRTVDQLESTALLEVQLLTGRKHQIRVQLAERGWPVRGDVKYDAEAPFPRGIGLHCRQLALIHPVKDAEVRVTAPLPLYWPAWCRQM